MSKAFTREDDGTTPPPPTPRASSLPKGIPNRTTRAGVLELRRRLDAAVVSGDKETAARLGLVLSTVVETPPSQQPADVMAFGRVAHIRDGNGRTRTVQVVGVDEADAAAGRVSWVSPLGKALLGARAGDTVELESPRGDEELTLLEVRPEPA